MENLYTEVRFGVADLQKGFNVISDFTECKLMYLNAVGTFKKIINFLLAKHTGEIIRVISPNRIISKQIINYTLRRQGYKPTYASSVEQAVEKIEKESKRKELRFHFYEQAVVIIADEKKHTGHIINISTGGCAINSATIKPKPGDEIRLQFALQRPGSPEAFNFRAEVVRLESYTFAVKFQDLTSEEKNQLWECLVAESGKELN